MNRTDLIASVLLLCGTLLVFSPTLSADFVNFDDRVYVLENFDLQQSLDIFGVGWAFGETQRLWHWHPLTWLSLMLDFQLFGLEAWGYHLTSLLLHAANVLLLYWLLRASTGTAWCSFAVAALFAWHPLHVESVAWISARKDVLSTLFWLAAMLAYLGWARRPSVRGYFYVTLFFTLGLLSKPMVLTLPCVLLLWDYWPLRRRAIREKIPLFLLAAGSGLMTMLAMGRGGGLRSRAAFSLTERLEHVVVSYAEYLRKMVWPVDLNPFTPRPAEGWPMERVLLAAGILIALSLLAWRRPATRVGWGWYLVTLLPVSGIVPVGSQAWADRYTYVPLIGVFVAVVWGLHSDERVRSSHGGFASDTLAKPPSEVQRRWSGQQLLRCGMAVVLVLCGWASWHQVGIWRDSVALWTHTLAVTDDNFLAHTNMASALEERGDLEGAQYHFQQATRVLPNNALGPRNLGFFLQRHGHWEEAAAAFQAAGRLDPVLRGLTVFPLRKLGRHAEADREEALSP